MTQNFVASELFYDRYLGGPKFNGNTSRNFTTALDVAANPIVSTDIAFELDQRPGTGWVVEVNGFVYSSGGGVLSLSTQTGQSYWSVNGVATANGGVQGIQALTDYGIGRQTTQYRLTFDGDVQTALIAMAGDPNSATFELRFRQVDTMRSGFWHGHATFGDFMTIPPNGIPANQTADYISASAYINDFLLRIASNNAARYNLAPVGATPRYVAECAFAGVDVSGFVICQSTDIGISAGQIPASVSDNTAERFRYHPNTFVRKMENVCGMAVRRGDRTALNATQQGSQPIGIYVNDDILTDTKWLIMQDGVVQIANLHISGSQDPRTPLQIWEQIFVPILQGSEATARSIEFNTATKINKQSYLQYARMVQRIGDTLTQTNTTPPG